MENIPYDQFITPTLLTANMHAFAEEKLKLSCPLHAAMMTLLAVVCKNSLSKIFYAHDFNPFVISAISPLILLPVLGSLFIYELSP